MRLIPTLLALTAVVSTRALAQETFVPVDDATISQAYPDKNAGHGETLRVRGVRGESYRSLMRFDLRSIGTDPVAARLRLYCTDASASGGHLLTQPDSGWTEMGVTWLNHSRSSVQSVATLGAVNDGGWVEVDVSSVIDGPGSYVFGLASTSSDSAIYSSREGAHAPEMVVTPLPGSGNRPVARFSGTPLSGQAPLQVAFADQSTGTIATWAWRFGDGTTSSLRNPVHTYEDEGTYSVTLTVTGSSGTNTLTKDGFVRTFSAARQGVWTSATELSGLAMSGTAWNNVLSEANSSAGTPDIQNQDDDTDVRVLAKALVYARTGNESYRTQVIAACRAAIGTEAGGRTLALGRNLIGYVLAADLVGLPSADDTAFRAWLRTCLTENLDGDTLRSTHEDRPNNWGTHAGASRAAVAAYLGDEAELARCAQVFKGWLGDRSSYAGFDYGDTSWQADPSRPVGINPRGATKDGHSIDGVLPDDQRRAGGFVWPPPKENYVWEALQGAVAQAVILHRAGYDVWEWQDQALLRAVRWLHEQCLYPASGDDDWEPHVINHFYGSSFPARIPSHPGKNVGWTDFTHR